MRLNPQPSMVCDWLLLRVMRLNPQPSVVCECKHLRYNETKSSGWKHSKLLDCTEFIVSTPVSNIRIPGVNQVLFSVVCASHHCVFLCIYLDIQSFTCRFQELLTRINYSKYANNSCTNYYLHRYETELFSKWTPNVLFQFSFVCLFVCF